MVLGRLLLLALLVSQASTFCPGDVAVPCSVASVSRYSRAASLNAAAKSAQETLKKSELIALISEATGMSKSEAGETLSTVFGVIKEQVGPEHNKKVNVPGFGTFSVKQRSARKGRNPKTGEEIQIAASLAPAFSASKTWKNQVNGKE